MKFTITLAVITAALASGCTTGPGAPDLGGIYNDAARYHDEFTNPVIVIPGILGSRLQSAGGEVAWGAFGGGAVNPERADGARLLALPMQPGLPLRDLRDDVRSVGALDRVRVRVFGLPVELSAYARILGTLGVGGYKDEGLGIDYGDDHFTCFQFHYDWRRDLVESAAELSDFIDRTTLEVQQGRHERFGTPLDAPVQFDIVAHSMGGLVVRYFLMYGSVDLPADGSLPDVTWAGASRVDTVVLVATPNAGSALSVEQLVDGASLAAFLPSYAPAILGTMPAIYQLLPRPRHASLTQDGVVLNAYDPALWERFGWGLADPDEERMLEWLLPDEPDAARRREIARDHLARCLRRAEAFAAAMDVPTTLPPDMTLHLFAGDAIATPRTATVDARGRVRLGPGEPGDGTVVRSSALLDERVGGDRADWSRGVRTPIPWSSATFLFTDHIGLTSDPAFTDNVLFLLLERWQDR